MQEDAVSSYKIQSRGRFKARVGECLKKSSPGRQHFIECPFVLGDESMAYFYLIQKDIPNFNLVKKKKRGIFAPAIMNS